MMCRKAITVTGVQESRCLLQSTGQGARQLLLYSWAPKGLKDEGSSRLELGLRSAYSACVQVPHWSVVLMTFLLLIGDTVLFREFYDGLVGPSWPGAYM